MISFLQGFPYNHTPVPSCGWTDRLHPECKQWERVPREQWERLMVIGSEGEAESWERFMMASELEGAVFLGWTDFDQPSNGIRCVFALTNGRTIAQQER